MEGETFRVNKSEPGTLMEAGRATRFGPAWPGRRCGARTRHGGLCQKPAIRGRWRCQLHGGRSTGPRTEAGRASIVAAPTRHGRRSRAHLEKVRELRAELRRITKAMRVAGLIP